MSGLGDILHKDAGCTGKLDHAEQSSRLAGLPIYGKNGRFASMSTMNISLPDELKSFVDHRIQTEGYGSSSEYMRELIRRDRDRAQFRQYLLDGIDAKPLGKMDAAYFATLRRQLRTAVKKKR